MNHNTFNVTIELVQKAIAEHADIGQIRVATPQEFAEYIRFVPMPLKLGEAWEFSFADISVTPMYICIDAQYVNTALQSTMIYSTILFTNVEDTFYTLEQSAEGDSLYVDGHSVYVTKNIHRTVMCWTDGLVYMQLSGEYQEQEGLLIVQDLLKEWYRR